MENKLPRINKKQLFESSYFLFDIEPVVRDLQLRILRWTSQIPENKRVNLPFVQEFEWSSNWAESIVTSLDGDSRYLYRPEIRLSGGHEPEAITSLFHNENQLIPKSASRLKMEELTGIVERLKHYQVTDIDHNLIDALYEACNWVVAESITEENCLRQLKTARDTVHRAELYMMMGKDVEAYREFKSITPEERGNPDNTLILVDLLERYDSARAAIKTLQRWFLLEIILHPLPFDLVYDLLSDRKKIEPSPRMRYLRSILAHSETMSPDELNDHLFLVIPSEMSIIPDPVEVDKRLNMFGLNLNSMDLILDDHEPINLYTLLAGVTDQLLHLADLARNSKNERLAATALERAILACFALMNMPETDSNRLIEPDNYDVVLTHQVLNDYLDEIIEIYDDLCTKSPSGFKYIALDKLIASLKNQIKKQVTDNILEESDGMPGLP
ncbi:MAG: hypothetical protein WBM02_04935 [bacterium]